MGTYLQDNPPRVRQFRERGTKPSGVIVVHTAENTPDWIGLDGAAEAVAAFIQNRTTFGSYHVIGDSDSRIRLVPFSMQAYGDGTGSNPHAMHLSAATQAAKWARAPKAWRDATIRQMARGAATYARWLKRHHGILIPARRITRAQSDARVPGFISHAERDPGRRSDPGADFPWDQFLAEYTEAMGDLLTPPAPEPRKPWHRRPVPKRLKRIARAQGLENVEAAARASRAAGLPFWAACALLEMESHGRNVFGHDRGGAGPHGARVTESRYHAFIAEVRDGARSNGVGPCQITWAGRLRDGKRDGGYFTEMEVMGLQPWVPFDSMRFGFAILRDAYNAAGDSWEKAGTAYNGSPEYGAKFLERVKEWRVRFDAKPGGLNPRLDFTPRFRRKP